MCRARHCFSKSVRPSTSFSGTVIYMNAHIIWVSVSLSNAGTGRNDCIFVKLLTPSRSAIILVLWGQTVLQYTLGDESDTGGTKKKWFLFFNQNRRRCHKWYETGPQLLWITNRKSQVADHSMSITCSNHERCAVRASITADLHTHAPTIWPSVIKFSMGI